jgi:endoglucanase Acf2
MKMMQWMGVLSLYVGAGLLLQSNAMAAEPEQKIGLGSLRSAPSSGDRSVPSAPFRTAEMLQKAAPTNQWYSSVMYTRWSEVLHAHPLTVKASEKGLEIGLPVKTIVPTPRKDVEIDFPHVADLTISPEAFKPEAALLAGHGDWSVDMSFEAKGQSMRTTVSHGSPFVYIKMSLGPALLNLIKGLSANVHSMQSNVLKVQGSGKHYAVFGPTGATWQTTETGAWRLVLPAGKGYLSAAVLPDDSDATFKRYLASAFAFVTDTKATFQFDRQSGKVTTSFDTTTQAMEGEQTTPLMGLYPHQYHQNPVLSGAPLGALGSIRGEIRLYQQKGFKTVNTYSGFVPHWPGVQNASVKADLSKQLAKEASRARRMMLEIGNGPYWQGKGLQRITQLMGVAESQGELEIRDQLLKLTQLRAQEWLSGESRKTYFHYSPVIGTVVAYPEEYDSVMDMNDHHFHYGYWIRAAAEIGLRDRDWASTAKWGGMIDQLVADIATPERGRKDFPYLRNFDPYEGHSWASGTGMSPHGNNQESSSEAINAWAGLILWGQLHNRPELTDLGIYLYTTEIQSINHYWFNLYGLSLPKEYMNAEVSMLFGGKLAHNTWWIDEPRQIHGINLLPITTSSTYLAQSPDFVKRNLAALENETQVYESRGKKAKPEDIWQDLFAKYLALVDPVAGMQRWDAWGSVELGDTRSHALHWMQSLKELGTPDLSVSSNTALFAVFKTADQQKNYLAYNPSAKPLMVKFSDGQELTVAPYSLGRAQATMSLKR